MKKFLLAALLALLPLAAQAQVSIVDVGKFSPAYAVASLGLAPVASATDVACVQGSATKTLRVTGVGLTGIATAVGTIDVVVLKRSTANSGGTSTTPTPVAIDSNAAAATGGARFYTANPTTGFLVGNLAVSKVTLGTTGAGGSIMGATTIGDVSVRGVTLRGVNEWLCVNLNGTTVSGEALDVSFTWVEEGP